MPFIDSPSQGSQNKFSAVEDLVNQIFLQEASKKRFILQQKYFEGEKAGHLLSRVAQAPRASSRTPVVREEGGNLLSETHDILAMFKHF